MKILFLSAANNPHTVKWVNGLNNRGNQIILVSLRNHQQMENSINKKIKIVYLPVKGIAGYYLNAYFINNLIKKEKPDVINVHYASGYGTLGRFLDFKNKILNVWGSDIFEFPKKRLLNKLILKRNLNAYNVIASTSYCMAEETKKYLNENKKVNITPFGVNVERFKKLNLPVFRKKIIIGVVKTLDEKYGIEYLIKSIKCLQNMLSIEEYSNLEVHIYGKGPLKNNLVLLVHELGIEEKIYFKGYIPNENIPKIINEMDVFVVPSLSESFGVAAIEAMACEVPVIVSDAPGLKEIVVNEKTGFVVPRKDPKAIAEKLLLLLRDSKLRYSLGKNGRDHVLKFYNWEKNLDTIIKLYNTILKKIE